MQLYVISVVVLFIVPVLFSLGQYLQYFLLQWLKPLCRGSVPSLGAFVITKGLLIIMTALVLACALLKKSVMLLCLRGGMLVSAVCISVKDATLVTGGT